MLDLPDMMAFTIRFARGRLQMTGSGGLHVGGDVGVVLLPS